MVKRFDPAEEREKSIFYIPSLQGWVSDEFLRQQPRRLIPFEARMPAIRLPLVRERAAVDFG